MTVDIACAAFVRDGKILFARRAAHKRHFPDHWDLVGGHVEPNENVPAAMIREAREEVGLTPTVFRLLAIATEEGVDGTTRYHVHVVTEWTGGEPKLLGDEHVAFRWVHPDDLSALQPMAHPQYASMLATLILVP